MLPEEVGKGLEVALAALHATHLVHVVGQDAA